MGAAMRIALYQPDIAGNVGTILRLCACMGVPLDLIEPMGFAWGASAMKRAGMDYADAAHVTRHVDWDAFRTSVDGRVVLATTNGSERLDRVRFEASDILLFGSEGAGAPDDVHARADLRVRVPMREGFRSLNVAISAAMMLGHALEQTGGWPESGIERCDRRDGK
jgi:tRNA (cytidine/uridine-2'-O-)-methyltransferase